VGYPGFQATDFVSAKSRIQLLIVTRFRKHVTRLQDSRRFGAGLAMASSSPSPAVEKIIMGYQVA
jgi:hypothetical protein